MPWPFSDILKEEAKNCPVFLRHKNTIIKPEVLRKLDIPVFEVVQEAGEFIVTFPFAYHSGYNHGYNCAEAVNFGIEEWIEWGKRASKVGLLTATPTYYNNSRIT